MRGPPRASAARWSRTSRSDRPRKRAATARASAAGSCFDRDARIPRRAPTPPSRRSTRRLLLLTRGYPAGRLRPTRPPRILLSCGSCFDRTRGYLAGPPRPRRNDGAFSRIPRCSLLLPASRGTRTALDGRAGARRPSPPPSPTRGEGAGVRAPCTESAQRPAPQAFRKGLPRERKRRSPERDRGLKRNRALPVARMCAASRLAGFRCSLEPPADFGSRDTPARLTRG